MWLRDKQAAAMKAAQAKPTARRSNVRSSFAGNSKGEMRAADKPTFFVLPPVWKFEPGKVTLVKAR
jgi:hypothetical protein